MDTANYIRQAIPDIKDGKLSCLSVYAKSADQGALSVYGASRTSDQAVTVVVVNKTYGSLTSTLSLANLPTNAAAAHVFLYSNANLAGIVAAPDVAVTPPAKGSVSSTVTTTFPGQSITLFVVPQS